MNSFESPETAIREVRFVDGALLVESHSRPEAHGAQLLSLPHGNSLPHSGKSLFTIEKRGDVITEDIVVVRGHGQPGKTFEKQLSDFRSGVIDVAPEVAEVFRRFRHAANEQTDLNPVHFWEVAPDIRLIPQRTPTLPPATHTNTLVVGAPGGDALLVEAPSAQETEIARLIGIVESLELRVCGVLVTHEHHDHVGGIDALATHFQAPVWAHPNTLARLSLSTVLTQSAHSVNDGDELDLGGQRIRLLHTPGHATGHICCAFLDANLLFAGDMVAGTGSILIDPGEGDLNEYWRQLERLATLPLRRLIPSHGGLVPDGPALLRWTAAHRKKRDAKVSAALKDLAQNAPTPLDAILARVYDDVPKAVLPLAKRSLLAHLEAMVARGEAEKVADGWRAL